MRIRSGGSIYEFERFGALVRDDHPLALYAGGRRLSPQPVIVWWWPWNWVLLVVFSPVILYRVARKRRRARKTD